MGTGHWRLNPAAPAHTICVTLIPAKFTLTAWEDTTFRKTITVLTGGPGSDARDLTGYYATFEIRTAPDTMPVYSINSTTPGPNGGLITLGGTLGTIMLYIPALDTSTIAGFGDGGIYVLVITATGGSGDSDALLWGAFRVAGAS